METENRLVAAWVGCRNGDYLKMTLLDLFFFFLNFGFWSDSFYLFVCLFVAALGSLAAHELFSGCDEQGLLFVAVGRLLIAVASLVAEHGL